MEGPPLRGGLVSFPGVDSEKDLAACENTAGHVSAEQPQATAATPRGPRSLRQPRWAELLRTGLGPRLP